MSWEKDIKELKKREKLAEKMGGKEKLQPTRIWLPGMLYLDV